MEAKTAFSVRIVLLIIVILGVFLSLNLVKDAFTREDRALSDFGTALNGGIAAWNSLMGTVKSLPLSEDPLPNLWARVGLRRGDLDRAARALQSSVAAAGGDAVLSEAVLGLLEAMEAPLSLLDELDSQLESLRMMPAGDALYVHERPLSLLLHYGSFDESFLVFQKIRGLLRVIDVYSFSFEESEQVIRSLISERMELLSRRSRGVQLFMVLGMTVALLVSLAFVLTVHKTLAKLVALRTAELSRSNEDLNAALETLKKVQGRLIDAEKISAVARIGAGVAHELNSPLAAILSSVNLALDDAGGLTDRLFSAAESCDPEGLRQLRVLVHDGVRAVSASQVRPASPRKSGLYRCLTASGREDAEAVSEAAATLGLIEQEERVLELLDAGRGDLLPIAAAWVGLYHSFSLVRAAALQASNSVGILSHYADQLNSSQVETIRPLAELREVVEAHRAKMLGRVSVEYRESASGTIRGSKSALGYVWSQLVLNALQAMEYQGKLLLSVEERGALLNVSVADSGPGVPAELVDKLFTPFFTTKVSGAGIGLGLELSRRIVERHGGRMFYERRDGWTVFSVELPAMPLA